MKKLFISLVFLSGVCAQTFRAPLTWAWTGRVHPELDWYTISTDNFNVHYHQDLEDIARRVNVEIGQLRPEEGEPGPDGVVESRVDLRAPGLSIDRLQKFLGEIKNAKGIIIVRRLKVIKPFRKQVVDIELDLATYKVRG